MRKMKKIVSILLAATMVLTSLNVLTFSSVASADEALEIDWSDDKGIFEYVNEPFVPIVKIYDNQQWYTTAIGEKLRCLDYIRAKSNKPTYAEGKSQLSFTANKGGTIYAVSFGALASYVDGTAVGGAWTALGAEDGHAQGTSYKNISTPSGADIDFTSDTRYGLLDQWIGSTENKGIDTNPSVPVNSYMPPELPYGFAVFYKASSNSGYRIYHAYTFAYKKDFSAGEKVEIPSAHESTHAPMYFIEWDDATDINIESVSYKVNGTDDATLEASDFVRIGNEYVAEVELAKGTTSVTNFVVAKDEADTASPVANVTFGENEYRKTATFTVASGNSTAVNTYKINFNIKVNIVWDTTNTTFAYNNKNDYKLVEYIEGDKFSPNDITMVNRGGSEGGAKWHAIFIGEKLRGLDYIRGRNTSKNKDDSLAANEKLDDLIAAKKPMISFTADAPGVVYAVSIASLDETYVCAENIAGGPWAPLNGVHGHDSRYAGSDWASRLNKAFALNNDIDNDLTATIHQEMFANGPYSCFVYNTWTQTNSAGEKEKGITTSLDLTYAYRKSFKAGEEVHIPSPGTVYYIPMYFIEYKKPLTDASVASIKTSINGPFIITKECDAGILEHNIELGYSDRSVDINITPNNSYATLQYTDADGKPLSNLAITPPGAGATKVVYATVKAEDSTIQTTYKFNITQKSDLTDYPDGFVTTNGSIMIEAEDVAIAGSGAQIESAADASGGKYVKLKGLDWPSDPYVLGDTSSSPISGEAPGDMGFELSFDQMGQYSIWMRYIATGSDSAWIDCGQSPESTGTNGYTNVGLPIDKSGAYLWKRIAVISESANATQTIRIRTRERGVIVDKFIITKYFGHTPEGLGELPGVDTPLVAPMPEDLYPIPTIVPTKGEHPRVLFKAEDIPQIKENMKASENAALVAEFNAHKERKDYTGVLENKAFNYNARGLEIIAAKAFDYAINGNEENGREAISIMKNYAATFRAYAAGDSTREKGHVLKNIGQVYDWCYDLLTKDDKEELMCYAQTISVDMEVGFPPDGQTMLCGHGCEWQLYRDWLTMAIACYDEYPDAYNMVAGKIFTPESVDYRNWWNQSGTHSQGTAYGPGRYEPEMYAHVLIKKMSGEELFNEEDLLKIPYDWVYRRRPDGALMIDGDDNTQNGSKAGTYVSNSKDAIFMAYIVSGDPVLKQEFLKQGGPKARYGREAIQPIEMLILNDPSVSADTPLESLPLTTYHASPVGEMIARTGWNMGFDSNDVVATMTMSEYNPMNHGHFEAGHFMIYYKGILANDSGWYEKHATSQHRNYMAQSVAHNTLVIETPYNTWGNQNQGIDGQGVDNSTGKNFYWIPSSWEEYQADPQNRFAEILGHEFGPSPQTPEYTYLAGDIANSYTSDYDNDVNEALRHMIFLPTGDEDYPAAFVVFDKIDTKTAGNKKAFLLHSEEEPQYSGNVTTITRTEDEYNGKLVNQTLLPKANNLTIKKIGGAELDEKGKVVPDENGSVIGQDKRFWNRDRNWFFLQDDPDIILTKDTAGRKVNPDGSLEPGWGRVEIMPTTSGNTDYMLNVMYVGSADDNSAVQQATLIETDSFAGAKIFDRVAVFSKAKARTKDTVSFTVSGSETALKVNVAGLAAGTWDIAVDGSKIDTQIASEEGGIIYFTAPAGNYTITRVSDFDDKDFDVIYKKLINSFSYEADNGDKKTESFASYDSDGNNSQVIDIMLTEGAKSVTVSDIIKNADIAGDISVKMTPSNGVVDLSSGKGSVEIYAAYPSAVVATDINKYVINFTVPVSITWHEQTYTDYIGGHFGPTTQIFGDNTGWYATAVGKKLRGLDFIRAKAKADNTNLEDVKNNNKALISFTADKGGTIYAVSIDSLDDAYVTGNPVGGAWESLNGVDGQKNGTVYRNASISADADIDTEFGDCWGPIDRWIRSAENIGIKDNPLLPVNAYEPPELPYGFTAFGTYSGQITYTGYTVQYTYGYAYKKEFDAGEKVDIPSPGTVKHTAPMYFIEWTESTTPPVSPEPSTPPAASSDVSVKSLTINGKTKEVADQSIVLEYDVETIDVELVANDENAKVTYFVNGKAVEVDENIAAPAIGGEAVVVTATITAQDEETTVTYTFTFTRKARSTAFSISVPDNEGNNKVTYKLSGGIEDTEYEDPEVEFNDTVELGTVYNLKAVPEEGYTFKYWEMAGNIVSEDAEYVYTVSLNSNINAVFAKNVAEDEAKEKIVILKNRSGQIFDRLILEKGGEAKTVGTPSQTGYEFVNWLRNDTNEACELTTLHYDSEELAGDTFIIFTAQYNVSETLYAVKVENGYISAAQGVLTSSKLTEGNYTYNTPIQVSTEGSKIFSHWIKDGKEKPVSYSKDYLFHLATADVTVKAVYVDTEEEKKDDAPFISISNMVKDVANGKIKFFTERYVPEDYTFIGAGLTVSKEQSGLGECEKLDASDTIFQWTSKNANANQFTATKANVGNYTWYAKAWLIYKDTEGNIETIYSDEENVSLAN